MRLFLIWFESTNNEIIDIAIFRLQEIQKKLRNMYYVMAHRETWSVSDIYFFNFVYYWG